MQNLKTEDRRIDISFSLSPKEVGMIFQLAFIGYMLFKIVPRNNN